jgi:flavodoxin
MKTLVVFYSRNGHTKKIGHVLGQALACDTEEFYDTTNRMGFFGWLRSGRDAMRKKLTIIKQISHNPSDYDLVILGTPNWGGMPCPAIRTYLVQNLRNFKSVAFFCTHGGSSADRVFAELERICERKAVALLNVKTEDVNKDLFADKIKQFVEKIK